MIFFLLSVLSVSQFAPETHVFDGNASKERIAADIAAIAEAGLDWRAPAVGGVQTGVLVTVSLPEKGSSMFHADVDLSPWKGKILKATTNLSGLSPRAFAVNALNWRISLRGGAGVWRWRRLRSGRSRRDVRRRP